MPNENIDEIIDNPLFSIPQGGTRDAGKKYGNFSDFVKAINPPRQIGIGEEIVNTDEAFVIIKRNIPILREVFAKPYFFITQKVRLTFHWEGIHILGANMESPNCFVLPVPLNEEDEANWFLKVSCLSTCSPGEKPLYVSVEQLRENLILKGVSIIAKVFAVISLCALLVLPFLYFISDTVRMYINLAVFNQSTTSSITIASLALFSIIIFSKRFDEIFTTLQHESPSLTVLKNGTKKISGGIKVIKRRT